MPTGWLERRSTERLFANVLEGSKGTQGKCCALGLVHLEILKPSPGLRGEGREESQERERERDRAREICVKGAVL